MRAKPNRSIQKCIADFAIWSMFVTTTTLCVSLAAFGIAAAAKSAGSARERLELWLQAMMLIVALAPAIAVGVWGLRTHYWYLHSWFRFRVRTLLILVAVFSLPLGWFAFSRAWIRARHAAEFHFRDGTLIAKSIQFAPPFEADPSLRTLPMLDARVMCCMPEPPSSNFDGEKPAPYWLGLFGETGHKVVFIPKGDDQEWYLLLFPEAEIGTLTGNYKLEP